MAVVGLHVTSPPPRKRHGRLYVTTAYWPRLWSRALHTPPPPYPSRGYVRVCAQAEDRNKFSTILDQIGVDQPEWAELSTVPPRLCSYQTILVSMLEQHEAASFTLAQPE